MAPRPPPARIAPMHPSIPRPEPRAAPDSRELNIVGKFKPEWRDSWPELARTLDIAIDRARRLKTVRAEMQPAGSASVLHLPELAEAGRRAISDLGRQLAVAQQQAEKHREALSQKLNETFAVEDRGTARQIRDAIRETPAKDRESLLGQHVADKTVAAAILGAPGLASGLTAEQYARFRTRAHQEHAPGTAAKLRELDKAIEATESGAANATAWLAETASLRKARIQDPDGAMVDGWRASWELGGPTPAA